MMRLVPSVGLWGRNPMFPVDAADFDGANDRMSRGAGLTGVSADSKLMTFVSWIKPDALGATARRLFSSVTTLGGSISTVVVDWHITVPNRLSVRGRDSAGNVRMSVNASVDPSTSAWTCLLFSCDMADSGKRHLYFGDTDVANWGSYEDAELDFTAADWSVGDAPGSGQKWDGGIAELWFKIGTYIDFSQQAKRREFISASGKPVNLGSDGSRPGLGVPECYFHLGDGEAAANFATNRGTGGNFSITGSLATASTSPSD